ncbi:YcfL family protein [Vibrio mangrovi]|nr:YcfL family protein [Vibrio mangrovi]MDW6003676.1 YcfL family protein [Vibrio mangrovi]
MKKWLLSFVVFAFVGCTNTHTAGLTVDSEYQRILFGDNVLASEVEVKDISTAEVNDHTRGVVRVKNKTSSDQHIQYRFYWYDEQGLEVNARPGPWRQAIIRGMDEVSLSEVSVSPKAVNFRVQIRELNQ